MNKNIHSAISYDEPANSEIAGYGEGNEVEEKISAYKREKLESIKFNIIYKPLLISLAGLFVSFFIDLSYVPVLGNVTINFAKMLFPNWQPLNQSIQPLSFWWIPIVCYGIFIAFAYKAFNDLKREVARKGGGTSSEIIDRISGSAISVVDGISTALPLIGAAILLISIKLGPEIFLGLSVPFEIKALIVLALGKLFEPVFDKLGIEFQHIINRASELKENFLTQLQLQNTRKMLRQIEENPGAGITGNVLSVDDMMKYNSVMERSMNLARDTYQYINAAGTLLEKMNSVPVISPQRLEELKQITASLMRAAESLKDEKTITALKSLENIVTNHKTL